MLCAKTPTHARRTRAAPLYHGLVAKRKAPRGWRGQAEQVNLRGAREPYAHLIILRQLVTQNRDKLIMPRWRCVQIFAYKNPVISARGCTPRKLSEKKILQRRARSWQQLPNPCIARWTSKRLLNRKNHAVVYVVEDILCE